MSKPKKLVDTWVEGEPKAQPRPRAFSRGGRIRLWDPGTADPWKALVAHELRPYRPEQPIDAPVLLVVEFHLPRPQRLMRAKDQEEPVGCKSKPDIDNLLKAVMDSLTDDGWWTDDAVVVATSASKMFHAKHSGPGAAISIYQLDEEARIHFE